MVNVTFLAHNRPRLTKQALSSLGSDPQICAIIRGDDLDDLETQTVIEDWRRGGGFERASYTVSIPTGTGAARNDVIATSERVFKRGDYLYLSDNDVFFYPAAFEKLVPVYEAVWKEGFKVLAAYNHPYHIPIASVPIHYGLNAPSCRVNQVQAVALQSMLMKWEVWDQYGPFTETPIGRVCMGEDVDFCHKILKDGGKLGVISPALVVNTGITNSFGEKIPGWEMVQKECPPGVLCE